MSTFSFFFTFFLRKPFDNVGNARYIIPALKITWATRVRVDIYTKPPIRKVTLK